MPELPDVEGFKRVLAGNALRKTIERVEVSDARILGKLSARTFASRLRGARLVAAHRHGKHLMARIDRGRGRLSPSRAPQGRPLSPLPVGAEGLQARRPHRLLLPPLSRLLTYGVYTARLY